jgi:hypothetical protein
MTLIIYSEDPNIKPARLELYDFTYNDWSEYLADGEDNVYMISVSDWEDIRAFLYKDEYEKYKDEIIRLIGAERSAFIAKELPEAGES